MRARTVALVTAAAVGLGACGDSEDETDLPAAVPATPTQTATAPAASSTTKTRSGISTDLSSKPEIPKPSGDPPDKLVTTDIVEGDGAAAKAGDNVVVHYVGVLHSSGEQFDASWDSGRPFPFVLGQGEVIPGWDEGVAGMKVGGRRLLTIPPDLAYGDQGQGSIGPNETLVFAVDLLNVSSG